MRAAVRRGVVLAWLVLSAAGSTAQERGLWLLQFPEIAFDSAHVYFSNRDWTGYYLGPARRMYTLPRDSMNVPEPFVPPDSVVVGGVAFAARGSALVRTSANGKSSTHSLRKPTREALELFSGQRGIGEHPRETLHPLAPGAGRVWFGVTLTNGAGGETAGGLGWFDTRRSRFYRIYDPMLAGYTPVWIGATEDSAFALFESTRDDERRTKFVVYSMWDETLVPFPLGTLGVGSEHVLNAAMWGDTLLLATETAVVIRRPDARPEVYSTRQYASREPVPLYLLTFDGRSATPLDSTRFQMLSPNKPLPVKAWLGDWVEITLPDAVQGYVDDAAWRQNQQRWAGLQWDCGDSLCFARIRVPHHNSFLEGDFIHVPLTYVSKDSNGIRVAFQAGWVRREHLLPVLQPR